MSDNDLVCNFKKCRKRLTNIAWVKKIYISIYLLLFFFFNFRKLYTYVNFVIQEYKGYENKF